MDSARILLADDDPSILETYGEILSMAGHEVDTAPDGEEALARIGARAYDLLLCDLVFPPTDGIHVLREAKRIRPRSSAAAGSLGSRSRRKRKWLSPQSPVRK